MSEPDTIPNAGIPNPCDRYGCPLPASHRVTHYGRAIEQGAVVAPDAMDLDLCDEHTQEEMRNGATHLEWYDRPALTGAR